MRVTDKNIDDIMDAAGYGITYWATQPTPEEWAANTGADYLIVEAPDEDERTVHPLSKAQVRAAFHKLRDPRQALVSPQHREPFMDAYKYGDEDGIDAGCIDADAADNLVQVAIFGQLVYG